MRVHILSIPFFFKLLSSTFFFSLSVNAMASYRVTTFLSMLVQGREDSKLPSQGSSGLLIWFIFLFSGCSHEPQSKHRCFLSISPQRCPINLLIKLKFLGPSKKFFASYFEFSGTQPVAPFGTSENPCVGTGVSIFALSMSTPVPQGCILKTSRGVT